MTRLDGVDLPGAQTTAPTHAALRRQGGHASHWSGQLLRLMASDAIRAAIERHYGVKLAFQNCHRAAVFRPGAVPAHAEFTTARSQILNQRPDLVDC